MLSYICEFLSNRHTHLNCTAMIVHSLYMGININLTTCCKGWWEEEERLNTTDQERNWKCSNVLSVQQTYTYEIPVACISCISVYLSELITGRESTWSKLRRDAPETKYSLDLEDATWWLRKFGMSCFDIYKIALLTTIFMISIYRPHRSHGWFWESRSSFIKNFHF